MQAHISACVSWVRNINCEMCGRESMLFRADVEGTMLNLCENCSRFGKVISAVREVPKEKKRVRARHEAYSPGKPRAEEFVLTVIPDYGDVIKRKREQSGMKQEDFAKKINEKASLLHKIETGQFEPSFGLARKIERALHIRLIEQKEVRPGEVRKTKEDHFTIGDFIKVKK
ncbi:multiprotein bridging factor aMBF1 [Candidatus Woesearchaeota archaeon]|nr:multiprotein bridging factor aMBF1 [Candidatus Woesearchaeota archaeon]